MNAKGGIFYWWGHPGGGRREMEKVTGIAYYRITLYTCVKRAY
jgi:hypothetical protein